LPENRGCPNLFFPDHWSRHVKRHVRGRTQASARRHAETRGLTIRMSAQSFTAAVAVRPHHEILLRKNVVSPNPTEYLHLALSNSLTNGERNFGELLHPIEKMWSIIKAFLRKAKARTWEALLAIIKAALQEVSGFDAHNWFQSCGYIQA
jgi:hypothetical protein